MPGSPRRLEQGEKRKKDEREEREEEPAVGEDAMVQPNQERHTDYTEREAGYCKEHRRLLRTASNEGEGQHGTCDDRQREGPPGDRVDERMRGRVDPAENAPPELPAEEVLVPRKRVRDHRSEEETELFRAWRLHVAGRNL